MRTTIRLDEDVFFAVKERARREHRSAGEVLSDLARQALSGSVRIERRADGDEFFGFAPLAPRGAAVSNDLIDQLREDAPEG